MCHEILDNIAWNRPIPFERVDSFVDFYNLIDGAYNDGVIPKSIWKFMGVKSPRIPTFYVLPKVHKQGHLRGRPIVSGTGSLTENASQYIDRILRLHVESLFSYTRDTLSLLHFLEDLTVPPGAILASM